MNIAWVIPALVAASGAETVNAVEVKTAPALLGLEPNRWVKIHEQKRGDAVFFRRQEHGGSCFDAKRGRLVLFGSNTHGGEWLNSPRIFDPVALSWTQPYPDDDFKTYAVTTDGLPVAGEKGNHPWTTHTFGAVVYDAARDEMVVCCAPEHMVPGRFTNVMADLWPKVKRHPTWTFSLATQTWTPLPCRPVSFFPHCAVYDSDRKVVVGLKPDGVYELAGEPREWTRVVSKGLFGYHTNAAYDAREKAVVVFGSNENANDVAVYRPAAKTYVLMPTSGVRPPKDQHAPMAFDPHLGKTVVVVDRVLEAATSSRPTKAQAETWLYDLAADAWTPVPGATLPFACGMNYNMEYDPRHQMLLLVTGGGAQPPAVWSLRLAPAPTTRPALP
jgi:hypothetical protein